MLRRYQTVRFDTIIATGRRYHGYRQFILVVAVVFGLASSPLPAAYESETRARTFIDQACHSADVETWISGLDAVRSVNRAPIVANEHTVGERIQIDFEDGDTIYLERFAPAGRLQRLALQYDERIADRSRPVAMLVSSADCKVQQARRLVYDGGVPLRVEELAANGLSIVAEHLLNPPVPIGSDPGGTPVAVVDSGVNYLLPEINTRLARDADGVLWGFDYWELDARPFDAHPTRSIFFPQRHGTQTASLLLQEAEVVRLVPYRYPRPDMQRMRELIDDVARRGIRIVNISMGGERRDQWQAFEDAARAQPQILFIVSAGNDGRNIDEYRVYPAALELDNLITVTSADDRRNRPAPGSNWGPKTVDFMVPAEDMITAGFDGHARLVSGSSYAAVRVSAFAACLLDRHPLWAVPQVIAALEAVADRTSAGKYVRYGSLPDPVEFRRGNCMPEPQAVGEARVYPLTTAMTEAASHRLQPSYVTVQGSGWDVEAIRAAVRGAAAILGQCRIELPLSYLHVFEAPARYRYFHIATANRLARATASQRPVVYFMKDTLQEIAFGGEAFGRSNSREHPALRDTVWIMRDSGQPGIMLAHELFHILSDSGAHQNNPDNLMYADSGESNRTLTQAQCQQAIDNGVANALLARL